MRLRHFRGVEGCWIVGHSVVTTSSSIHIHIYIHFRVYLTLLKVQVDEHVQTHEGDSLACCWNLGGRHVIAFDHQEVAVHKEEQETWLSGEYE